MPAQENVFANGRGSIWHTKIEKFATGIYTHFQLTLLIGYFFLIASIIAIPIMILCYFGQQPIPPTTIAIDKISIVNIGNNATIMWNHYNLDSNSISNLLTSCNIAIITILTMFYFIISIKLKIEENREFILSARDYTVYVENLPTNASEQEVFQHFNNCNVDSDDLVLNTTNTGNSTFLNSTIADIVMVKSVNMKIAIINKIKKLNENAGNSNGRYIQSRMEQLKTDLELIDHRNDPVIGAFVTFQNTELRDKSINQWWSPLHGKGSAGKKFRDKYSLTVSIAPDPSDIIWENLELTKTTRFIYQSIINLVLIIILLCSFFGLIIFQAQKYQISSTIPSSQFCNVVLPAVSYNIPVTSTGIGAELPHGLKLLYNTSNNLCTQFYWDSTNKGISSNECTRSCASTCMYTAYDNNQNITFPTSYINSCYCIKELDAEICKTTNINLLKYYLYIAGSSLLINIINHIIRMVLVKITSYEKHITISNEQKAITTKIFLFLITNTAILALPLIYSITRYISPSLYIGLYNTFSVPWYLIVGSNFVLIMIVNMISLPLNELFNVLFQYITGSAVAPDFDLVISTSTLANIFFSCIIYSAAFPLLLVIGLFSFIISYWSEKIGVLRLYSKTQIYHKSLLTFIVKIIPWTIICNIFITIWMFSEDEILYSNNATYDTRIIEAINYVFPQWLSQRLIKENTLPLFIMLVLTIMCLPLFYLFVKIARTKRIKKSSFTNVFELPVTKGEHLAQWELDAGWIIIPTKSTYDIKIRQYSNGRRMLTWEVIADQGIASYRLTDQPNFKIDEIDFNAIK